MKKTIILLAVASLIMASGCAFDEWARIDNAPMDRNQFKKDYDGFKGCKWWSVYGEGSNWGLSMIPLYVQPSLGDRQTQRLNECMEKKGYIKAGR